MVIRISASVAAMVLAAGLAFPSVAEEARPAGEPAPRAEPQLAPAAAPSGPAVRKPAVAEKASTAASAIGGQVGDAPSANPMAVFSGRGGTLAPVVVFLQSQGVKLTDLGDEGGLRGYLGEAANGHYQSFYVSKDGQYIAVGMMFRAGGASVTGRQVESMMKRFQDAARSAAVDQKVDVSTLKDIVPDETGSPDVDLPVVDWFRSKGLTVTPFGSREGGFDAFFVETQHDEGKKGVMQTFYVMPDSRFAVAGFLSQRGGVNVTGLQIADMKMRAAEKQQVEIAVKGSSVAPGVLSPSAPEVSVEKIVAATTPREAQPQSKGVPVVVEGAESLAKAAPAASPSSPPQALPIPASAPDAVQVPFKPAPSAAVVIGPEFPNLQVSTAEPKASDPYRSKLESAVFLEALKTSAWFVVGAADAPVVYMVADPQCPFCHAAWQKLKPLVFARKLQVRVVLISGLKGSYPLAVSILSRKGADGASKAWLSGEGSMHDVPIEKGPNPGSADWDQASKILQLNGHFIDRFAIDRTPFLAYESKAGVLYTSLGLPEDINAYFAALQPR